MAAADSVGPVFLLLLPFTRLLPPPACAFELSFQTSQGFPPLLAWTTSPACVGTHMSRIPTVFPLTREREGGIHISPSPYVERTRDARALNTYTTCTHTYARVRSRERSATCTHVRALLPRFLGTRAFQNCPRDGSTDKCSFLFATHAWAIWAFRQVSPKCDGINRPIRFGMLIRNLDRSRLAENRVLAR